MSLFRDPAKDLARSGINPESVQPVAQPTPTPTSVPLVEAMRSPEQVQADLAESLAWEDKVKQDPPINVMYYQPGGPVTDADGRINATDYEGMRELQDRPLYELLKKAGLAE